MRLTHLIDNYKLSREAPNGASLLTTNNLGAYLWLRNKDYSRYQGWFIRFEGEIYKIIDDITINSDREIKELKNIWQGSDHYLQRIRSDNIIEDFYLANRQNCFIYKLSRTSEINLFLDIRKSYALPRWNRFYQIYEQGGYIIIRYQDNLTESIFLAISLSGVNKYEKVGEWVQKKASYDKKRQSPPYEVYIYNALKITTDRLIIGVGSSEKQATANTDEHESYLDNMDKHEFHTNNTSRKLAYILAQKSLASLLVYNKQGDSLGLYAGLPWFFQFWLRDEAISLKALSAFNPRAAKNVIDRRLSQIISGKYNQSVKPSQDGVLWLIYQTLKSYTNNHELTRILEELVPIREIGEISVKSSWMDTLSRQGAIENYCLELAIYRLAYQITRKEEYQQAEQSLKDKIRLNYWNGAMLADCRDDWTIRPNLFLAYYLYPQLLTKEEWTKCFERALSALWLDWGGLASVDKDSPLYLPFHTGEKPNSYHNGDSWFWLNNIAAIAMLKLDKDRFKDRVEKIIDASTKDILWRGALGYASELSSAKHFDPAGSPAQAWSMAIYTELLDATRKLTQI